MCDVCVIWTSVGIMQPNSLSRRSATDDICGLVHEFVGTVVDEKSRYQYSGRFGCPVTGCTSFFRM